MAWGAGIGIGSANTKAGTTSLTISGVAAAVGTVVIVRTAADNNSQTAPDIAQIVVTDSKGNTYTRIRESQNNKADGATVTCGMYYTQVTTALVSGDTITLTDSTGNGDRTAWAAAATRHTVDAGSTISVAGNAAAVLDDGADPSAISISGLASSEYLWIHALGAEGPATDAYTWDADYTRTVTDGTTGGGAASNIQVTGGERIFTGTTDTVDVTSTTADREYVQLFAALLETLVVDRYRQPIIVRQAAQRAVVR